MSPLPEMLQHAEPLLHKYGLWVVFVNILLETFGLPLPGETLLIAAALLAAKGVFSLPLLLVSAWGGAVLGDNIAFYAGHYGGRRLLLRFGGKVGITRQHIRKMERFYKRFGPEVVLIARFFVVARQLNGLVGGAMGMQPLRFFIYNVLGAALWIGFWGIGSYYLGSQVQVLLKWGTRIMVPVMIVTTVGGLGLLIYRIWRNSRK